MDAKTIFIQFLQACITPVTMISGVGLFLLTFTNQRGRIIDRLRHLISELDTENIKRREEKQQEILIFYQRSRLLKNSIICLMTGMISSCLMIPLLFIMSFTTLDLRILGYAFFLIAIASMLTSFTYFLRDVLLSLQAIKLEANEYIV